MYYIYKNRKRCPAKGYRMEKRVVVLSLEV